MGFGSSFKKAFHHKFFKKVATGLGFDKVVKGVGGMLRLNETSAERRMRESQENVAKQQIASMEEAKRTKENQEAFDREQARLTSQFQTEQEMGAVKQEKRYDFSKVSLGKDEEEDEDDILLKSMRRR